MLIEIPEAATAVTVSHPIIKKNCLTPSLPLSKWRGGRIETLRET